MSNSKARRERFRRVSATLIVSVLCLTLVATLAACSTGGSGYATDGLPADENLTNEPVDPADLGDGTVESPLILGQPHDGAEWTVVINGVNRDADTLMAAGDEPQYPAEGNQFVVVSVTITYTGDTTEGAKPDLTLMWITDDGDEIPLSPTQAPWPIDMDSLSRAGAPTTGNLLFEVPADDQGVISVRTGDAEPVFAVTG